MWKTIDSAPKDGTNILVYTYEIITCAFWCSDYKSWRLSIAGSYAEEDDVDPTHWIPLPKPPEEVCNT